MDLILQRFLVTGYPGLDGAGRDTFDRLLDIPDQRLYGWILGSESTSDPAFASLVDLIRELAAPNLAKPTSEGDSA